jgi:UDP-N-acetylglucosamine:LPS N-acetylglucosamine transferase
MTEAITEQHGTGNGKSCAVAGSGDRPPRVLVLTTDIGEGHDLPAREVARAVLEQRPDAHVTVTDGLAAMGRLMSAILKDQSRLVFWAPKWVFDLEYFLGLRFKPTAWFSVTFSFLFGGRGLLRLIRSERPDVIVSTYPGTTMVLAKFRRYGYVKVPAISAITDLASLYNWACPGIDLHLTTHPESEPEVRKLAGPTEVLCVRGLTSRGFTDPADPEAGRREFDLPEDAHVVVVSGGGWGVGDVEGAVEVALATDGTHVVVLCGRNEEVRERMEGRFGSNARVHVSGFTEHMSELFAAADVLIHSTAGLTVLEAYIRGCRVISYGWGVAHIKANNAGYVRHGIADVARNRDELAAALRRALAEPGVERHEEFAALPDVASVVLEAARVRERV